MENASVHLAGNSSNQTTPPVSDAEPCLLIIHFVLVIVAAALNALALVHFLRHTHRTPFNTVVVNLLFSNLCFLILESPYSYAMTKGGGLQWLGVKSYLIYAYIIRYTASVEVFSHAVVSANRFWAVTWPYHYRRCYTQKTSVCICAGIWVFAHIIAIPSTVLQVNYTWTTVIRFIPLTVVVYIIGSFPYIWFTRKKQRKRTQAYPMEVRSMDANSRRRSEQQGSPPESGAPLTDPTNPKRPRRFLLLACLTLSIFLNWTPTFILEILFPYYKNLNMSKIREWLVVFYTLQCVVDPVLFATTLNVSLTPFRRTWCNCTRRYRP